MPEVYDRAERGRVKGFAVDPEDRQKVAPYTRAVAVTTSNEDDIEPTYGLFIGGAGNVRVNLAHGGDVTFQGLDAGQVLPISVTRVWTSDTTATNIVALY